MWRTDHCKRDSIKGPSSHVAYRSRQLAFWRTQITKFCAHEYLQLQEDREACSSQGELIDEEYFVTRVLDIEKEAQRQEKDACNVIVVSRSYIGGFVTLLSPCYDRSMRENGNKKSSVNQKDSDTFYNMRQETGVGGVFHQQSELQ
jgi:hypothetical protein